MRVVRDWLAERAAAGVAAPTLLNDIGNVTAGLARVAYLSRPAAARLDDAREAIRRWLPDHVVRQAVPAVLRHVQAVERVADADAAFTVRLAWHLAARHADVFGLTPTDVTLPRPGLAYVRYRRTKTSQHGVSRLAVAALPPGTWQELQRRLRAGDLRLSPYPAFVRALQQAEPTLTGHSLRRGAVQALLDASIPVAEIQRLTGHTEVASLLRYADRPPPSALAAAPLMAAALGVPDWPGFSP